MFLALISALRSGVAVAAIQLAECALRHHDCHGAAGASARNMMMMALMS